MNKIAPLISPIRRYLPSLASPIEKKITLAIEKLQDPQIKVVVISDKRSKFKIIRNCTLLGAALFLLKEKDTHKKEPLSIHSPFYLPLAPTALFLKKQLEEKKQDEYGIESITYLIEKASKVAKNMLESFSGYFLNCISFEETTLQKKQIEQLTQENSYLKQLITEHLTQAKSEREHFFQAQEEKAQISRNVIESHLFEIKTEQKNISNRQEEQGKQLRSLKDAQENFTSTLTTLKSQNKKIEELSKHFLEIENELTSKLSELQISAASSLDLSKSQKDKIHNLSTAMKACSLQLQELERKLSSLEKKSDFFQQNIQVLSIEIYRQKDHLDAQKKAIEELSSQVQLTTSLAENIQGELNKSTFERIKNLPEKISTLSEELLKHSFD